MNLNDACETVTVQTTNGPVLINKSDYEANKSKYKLATKAQQEMQVAKTDEGGDDNTANTNGPDGKPLVTADQMTDTQRLPVLTPDTPSSSFPDDVFVAKESKKFFVVDAAGKKVEYEGLDHNAGYDNDADAWKAVMDIRSKQTQHPAAPQG